MKRLPILFAFCLLVSHVSYAQPVKVVTEEIPNFQNIKNGKLSDGLAFEIVDLVFKEAAITPDYYILPWLRAYKSASTEPDTFIFTLMRIASREQNFNWVAKLFSITPNLAALATQKSVQINSIADIHNYRIAAVRGDFGDQYLRDIGLIENQNLQLVGNYRQMWKMLYIGRVDAVFTNPLTAANELAQIDKQLASIVNVYDLVDATTDLYLATNLATSPEIVTKLKQAYTRLVEQGEVAGIQQKWQKVFDQTALTKRQATN